VKWTKLILLSISILAMLVTTVVTLATVTL